MTLSPRAVEAAAFPYVYFWHRMDRKGQRCDVLARGKMNSCLVKFEDGFTAITSRNALRRAVGIAAASDGEDSPPAGTEG